MILRRIKNLSENAFIPHYCEIGPLCDFKPTLVIQYILIIWLTYGIRVDYESMINLINLKIWSKKNLAKTYIIIIVYNIGAWHEVLIKEPQTKKK